MEAILDLPVSLPPHDAAPLQPVPHRIVAEWPAGTFIENLAVDGDAVIVSVLSEARLDRVPIDSNDPRLTKGQATSILRQFDRPATGLSLVDGHLFAAVGEPGDGEPELWRLDPGTGEGEPWCTLTGIEFANGVTPFAPGKLMIAESWKGRLCVVDLAAKTVSVWIEDERLTRQPGIDFLPGANGVKRFGNEVTVSSNGRALLLRATVNPDGTAGRLDVIAERLRVDDMAYDADGVLYLTTHIGHSLDWLDRDGTRVALGGAAQGLAGSTACAFGNDGALYVTTTGAILAPPGRVLQPAKLVRLEVDVRGHALDRAWEV